MKTNLSILFCFALFLLTGCDDEDSFPHRSPDGMGSLVVDNHTYADLKVYLDGYLLYEVDDYDYEIADLNPGVYRIVIYDKDGYHSFREDIDIILGKLTVIRIEGFYNSTTFETKVYFN